MSVVSMVVGAPTPDGATFVVEVDGGGPVRVAVATDAGMTAPVFTASQAVDAQGVAKVSITGLDSSTQHWWQVEDDAVLDTANTGSFRTAPVSGQVASFTFSAAGDAGAGDSGFVTDRISNHPVHDNIRAADPDFFIHMGDWGYRDIGSGVHTSAPFNETDYRDQYDDNLAAPRQAELWRNVPIVYTWDNHDFGFTTGSAIDSDGDLPHKAAARIVYQERVPHFPLPAGSGNVPIYHSFTYGRVLFVVLDVRSERSPNSDPDDASKTMLGAAQKLWLDTLLATSDASALCLISAGQWLTEPTESDTWAAYETERAEIVQMLSDRGWLHRMWMITASKHALGLDSGSGNTHGGFPVALFAALDAGSVDDEPQQNLYDQGITQPGPGQYGTVEVTDLGSAIAVTLTGWHYQTGEYASVQFAIPASTPTAVSSGALLRALTGSHTATFDARILTTFQTGEDPDGTTVAVIDGQVDLDGTAEVRGAADVTVGEQRWPSRPDDLLAPWGNEVFLRRGVDFGAGGIEWVPLGYYRIVDPGQGMAPSGPIQLACFDRMWVIRRSQLLQPRQYPSGTTLGAIVRDLVLEVYPLAQIVWDDGQDQTSLQRPLVVERERYGTLHEVAVAVGKIVYWDRIGQLRLEAPPDPGEPVWRVNQGADGVLVEPSRRLSTETAFNAVVVEGEGGDTSTPVRGVAFDSGANSPTRFGGRFGRIPEFVNNPMVTTESQAQTAAVNYLRRNLGAPYEVSFTAVPNPALDPFDPIRVDYADSTSELHVMRTVSIPLSVEAPLSGTTREQRLIAITTG